MNECQCWVHICICVYYVCIIYADAEDVLTIQGVAKRPPAKRKSKDSSDGGGELVCMCVQS